MRILIDASCFGAPRTGVGRYAENIISRLSCRIPGARLRYFDGVGWRSEAPKADTGAEGTVRRAAKALPGARLLWRRLRAELWRREEPAERVGIPTVAFAPNFRLPRLGSLCVPVVHDLAFVRRPETLPRERRTWLKGVERQLATASEVIAVSPFTAREISAHFGVAAERILVAPPAAEPWFRYAETFPASSSFGAYFLAVGTLEPRKNLGLLIEAYGRLPDALRARLPLILAGPMGWGCWGDGPRTRALIAAGQLRLLSYVPDQALPALYARAVALCMPSLYEGFGMPVIEAQSAGTPALVSDAAALPDTVGPGGLVLPPDDVEPWTQAMMRLSEDRELRQVLSEAGRTHARRYDWEHSADVVAGALRRAGGAAA